MLLLLKITGAYKKIGNKINLIGKCTFKAALLLLIASFHINDILYKCQICWLKTGENTLNNEMSTLGALLSLMKNL